MRSNYFAISLILVLAILSKTNAEQTNKKLRMGRKLVESPPVDKKDKNDEKESIQSFSQEEREEFINAEQDIQMIDKNNAISIQGKSYSLNDDDLDYVWAFTSDATCIVDEISQPCAATQTCTTFKKCTSDSCTCIIVTKNIAGNVRYIDVIDKCTDENVIHFESVNINTMAKINEADIVEAARAHGHEDIMDDIFVEEGDELLTPEERRRNRISSLRKQFENSTIDDSGHRSNERTLDELDESEDPFYCTTYRLVEVAIAFDSTFCAAEGGEANAIAEIQSIVALASLSFEAQGVCIKVAISHIDGYCDEATDPYAEGIALNNIGCSSYGLISWFKTFWYANRPTENVDSAHLFYAKSLEPKNTRGCANFYKVCNKAVGVNDMSFNTNLQKRAYLFSHELGHNFGMDHRKNENGEKYIMKGVPGRGTYIWHPSDLETFDYVKEQPNLSCLPEISNDSPTPPPTPSPTASPTTSPTTSPTPSPTVSPTTSPTTSPTSSPTVSPTTSPTSSPTVSPTSSPTTTSPTISPTNLHSTSPTRSPTDSPTALPTKSPTNSPTRSPTSFHSKPPSSFHSESPSSFHSESPTTSPTAPPTATPTKSATNSPSRFPTSFHSNSPSSIHSNSPSSQHSESPTTSPTASPTKSPTNSLSRSPTSFHSNSPSSIHSNSPSSIHSESPSSLHSESPSSFHSESPTNYPTSAPTTPPTTSPTSAPTNSPTKSPTNSPTKSPTNSPTKSPTNSPTKSPTGSPTKSPTNSPTKYPTKSPTGPDTLFPTISPTTNLESSDINKYESGGARGDPHFKTWDGDVYDFHGICDLVLLRNPDFMNGLGMDIHIRTKKTLQWSYISTAVILIGGETLEISAEKEGEQYWINGVLGEENSHNNGYLPETISGFQIKFRLINSKQREYVIYLGNGDKIVFITWKKMIRVDVNCSTAANFASSVGLMGMFSNSAKVGRDHSTIFKNLIDFGQEWQVLASEPKLFHNIDGPQAPSRCVIPTKESLRRRLAESVVSFEGAQKACSHIVEKQDFDLCVFDTMATGDLDIAGAY